MVLIDNAPYSYLFQLENGIPVLPYVEGEDQELMFLEKYLEEVRKVDDVREINKRMFQLHKYGFFGEVEDMVISLYGKK